MVADQLNNSGWQERLASCKVLPLLHNKINKDMCTKLLQLAWEDWSPEVQLGAAVALGKTSHGKVALYVSVLVGRYPILCTTSLR